MDTVLAFMATVALLYAARAGYRRLQLSIAKHPSLRGHSRMAKRIGRWLPAWSLDEDSFFDCDGADAATRQRRQAGFESLALRLHERTAASRATTMQLADGLSDLQLTGQYRVPFPFRAHVERRLPTPVVVETSENNRLQDLDGNWYHDLTGAYGVNLLGTDFYKRTIADGAGKVARLGPVLGPLHPVVLDNVRRLREISGKDEVSFHMSGTEAVMQAVALARYHTGRPRAVRFCGAYHGWWDGVQPGPGNPRDVRDVYTLKEMDPDTLRVLRTRSDIACVLVNPVQAMHPNGNPPGDAGLLSSARKAGFDREAYRLWLQALRAVCTARGIVFILDEILVGFRLDWRGAQGYFDVDADLVTYGKTLGGGLPVGVVCGRHELMKRYDDDRPAHLCFARGTFNSHPYVMGAMNAFLEALDDPTVRPDYARLDVTWDERASAWNARLAQAGVPLTVRHMSSIFVVTFDRPSRYNWMLQYYLRDAGLWLSWVGSGRLIFQHDCPDDDFSDIVDAFISGASRMQEDGWWEPGTLRDNRSIGLKLLRETLSARFSRSSSSAGASAQDLPDRI